MAVRFAADGRRLDGWGWRGRSMVPSPELVRWLGERLGSLSPRPAAGLSPAAVPAPAALPELPGAVSVDPIDRLAHARGRAFPDLAWLRSGRVPAVPDVVARPESTEEVEEILGRCETGGVRVIPWGGGTSVTGGVNVPADGVPTVSLDLERMSGLLSLDLAAGVALFGAGTRGPAVEAALASSGLTLGHFPQSWELSTLGGWIVTHSSGQESSCYGRIEDLVAGCVLVAPAGRLELPPMPASAAGPDLRRLVVGSEGRLGVLTRAAVRVRPAPSGKEVRAWLLPSWGAGLAACRALAREGVPLALVRLSDEAETEAALEQGLGSGLAGTLAQRYLDLRGVANGCLLLTGVHGGPTRRRAVLGRSRDVLAPFAAVSLGSRAGRGWLADRFRHPYLRDSLLDLGVGVETLETAAPWSQLGRLTRAVRGALTTTLDRESESVAVLCHLSHSYLDGASLYFTFFFRLPAEPAAAIARWGRLKRAATEAILEEGGTVSHHHGVGRWHAPWLAREIGESGMAILRAASSAVDPRGVVNPQVLLEAPGDVEKAAS